MSTEQFVAALTEYRLDPTEIAEILWLALRQPLPEEPEEPAQGSEDKDKEGQDDGTETGAGDQGGTTDNDTFDQEDESEEDDEDPSFEIAPELPSGILPKKALPISVPDAGLLDDTLPLVRAMKPLLKQIESQMVSTVNEVETVERIAETDIWSPVLNPDQEPWFEVALVVDGSPAMSIWQRLVQDIQRLLRCYGSFRDFRVWQLAEANGEVGICSMPDSEPVIRSPRALLSPDARRLILVFSDCTANYWWDGSLQPILALWGESTPTTVWQVLPDWMWKRTALGIGEYVAVRNHNPGAKNTKLTPVFLSLRSSARRGRQQANQETDDDQSSLASAPICIPVVTSENKSLGAWSRMLAGDRRYSTPGFILPVSGWSSTATTEPEDSEAEGIADELLENFRVKATPAARRLAALLSAAPIITLPVMRLIRASDELLPGASPLPVAEVFLGGLLKKAPEQSATNDPELVQYTFPNEVRDRLLDVLPKVDAIEVIEAVSNYVAERLNCTLADFRALLLSPDLKDEADRYGLRSFATMTAQILRKVGPEFADLVRQLEGTPEPGDSGTEPEKNDTADWLADFPLQDFDYEVAQYLNLPPLETFNFNDGQLEDEDDLFPPPLETENFTIVTFEPAEETLIMGRGLASEDYFRAFLNELNPSILEHYPDLPRHYREEAEIEGVNQDIAFCQMLVETQELANERRLSQNNFGGIESGEGGNEEVSFPSSRLGIRAHIQRLKAYASVEPLVQEVIDPQFQFVSRGSAPLVQQLDGIWNSDDLGYSDRIMEYMRRLHAIEPTANLEPFSFTVATLQRVNQNTEWEIHRQQQSARRFLGIVGSAGLAEPLEMVVIPAGTFQMGAPTGKEGVRRTEGPQHEVSVASFLMGRYPITQLQWYVVAHLPKVERELNPDPSSFKGDNRPVENVSWYDAVEFCARLSAHSGIAYRLPTEAEWEYACRAGTTTPFHFGETISPELANYKGSSTYANGPEGEDRRETTPVDYFGIASAFGLSDMHGNVLEWCQDYSYFTYDGAPTDGSAWIEGEGVNWGRRILRGGSWADGPGNCRSACRSDDEPDNRVGNIGFRVCCTASRK